MNTKTIILISAVCLALNACAAPRSTTNSLQLGMSRAEVQKIMGEPDSSSAIKGQGECFYYSMWRDFWNRRLGDYSDRYYVCFQKGKVVAYGRAGDPT
jgi:outer membrane protein assembly factor BamE (lipoprotein component of BamABCDE complex)